VNLISYLGEHSRRRLAGEYIQHGVFLGSAECRPTSQALVKDIEMISIYPNVLGWRREGDERASGQVDEWPAGTEVWGR
jgi:hypothetical protein